MTNYMITAFLCACLFSSLLSMKGEDFPHHLPPLEMESLLTDVNRMQDSFLEHLIAPSPTQDFESPFNPCFFSDPTVISCGQGKPRIAYPLHDAIDFDSATVIHYLIRWMGINPNVINHNGDTPLHLAIRERKLTATAALLHYQVTMDVPNRYNQTPLDLIGKHKGLLKLLNKYRMRKKKICKKIKLESGV